MKPRVSRCNFGSDLFLDYARASGGFALLAIHAVLFERTQKMRFMLLISFIVAATFTSGCATTDEYVASAPVNAKCPIMGGKVRPDGGSATWNGQLIGFCCEGCEPRWQKLSDVEKAEKLADMNRDRQYDHGNHNHHG